MYIRVTAQHVSLEEPEDTKRFKVVCADPATDVGVALQSAGFGELDGGEALIEVEAVRRAASGRVADSWAGEFDGMIAYATSKGWITDDGSRIRAHIEAEE